MSLNMWMAVNKFGLECCVIFLSLLCQTSMLFVVRVLCVPKWFHIGLLPSTHCSVTWSVWVPLDRPRLCLLVSGIRSLLSCLREAEAGLLHVERVSLHLRFLYMESGDRCALRQIHWVKWKKHPFVCKNCGNWFNFFCAAPRYLTHDLFANDVGVVCWVCRYVVECRQGILATSFDTSPEHLVFSSTVYAINVSVRCQVMTPFSADDVLNVQMCVCNDWIWLNECWIVS